MHTLYARRIRLRNCGRFSVIRSDFGADYRTHIHVTGEALYASLTRGATWSPTPIVVKQDQYDFTRDYNVEQMPLWFTPGVFQGQDAELRPTDEDLDVTFFNSVGEAYPSTSNSYQFNKRTGELSSGSRPNYAPTYGTWQAVLPNRQMITIAFSPNQELLTRFEEKQVFLLGKKRTMFQIEEMSSTVEGEWETGECSTGCWIQVTPIQSTEFQAFEVLDAAMRYIIMRGKTRNGSRYISFLFEDGQVCLPNFYVEGIPMLI